MQTFSRDIALDAQQTRLVSSPHASSTQAELQAEHTSRLLARLDSILQSLFPARPLEQIVSSLASAIQQALEIDLCVVMLAEERRLVVAATSPDLPGDLRDLPALQVAPDVWERLQAGADAVFHVHEQEQLNPLKNVDYRALHLIPLATGAGCVGLVLGYSGRVRDLSEQDQHTLNAISSFAAISIHNRKLLDAAGAGVSAQVFFDDLLAGKGDADDSLRGRAAALGLDTTIPYAVLLVEVVNISSATVEALACHPSPYQRAVEHLKHSLQERGALLNERESHLYCLIPSGKDVEGLKTWLDQLLRHIDHEHHVTMFAGLSNSCPDVRDFTRGLREAEETVKIGQCLGRLPGSLSFDELGAYRYVYAFARQNTLHDRYSAFIERLVAYDQGRKNADLLETLQIYLELGGNIKDTAERLGIHRNTLTQRLERIESLCGVHLDHLACHLPLQLAIMVHRLRACTR